MPPSTQPAKRRRTSNSDDEGGDAAIGDDEKVTLLQLLLEVSKGLDLGDAKVLEERRQLEEDRKKKKPPKRPKVRKFPANFDSLQKQVESAKARLVKAEAASRIKDGTMAVSLGTSKTNYIDPRVICAWCQREKVRYTRVYSKSLLQKFPWAVRCDPDFVFGADPPPPLEGGGDDSDSGSDDNSSGSD
eukprot:TRINITY_DN18336_c0_g1_i1.p2 TRINITY_DN18336_c0_g1~~TRINITY_DN18336_c0_g1_i1.p2  ORF type:complete len:188 (+),score=72.22 TRINITY_DN18336_c0_g1_i1:58-621(+)